MPFAKNWLAVKMMVVAGYKMANSSGTPTGYSVALGEDII